MATTGGFAARGDACFSIGYRLTQELPPPPLRPIRRDSQSIPHRERTDWVRKLLGQPPVLLFTAEHDLPSTPPRARALERCAARAGIGVRHYGVPGKPHFYDRESPVVLQASTMPGGEACGTVEAAIERFLADSLAPATASAGRLDAFAQASSRRDIETSRR